MTGAGTDIWGTSDEFHYVSRQMTGDGQIVARVASVASVDDWTKAGVMMRDTLTAGSTHAHMLVSATQGLAFQRRTSTGSTSTHTAGGAGTAPVWVRLTRTGNTCTAEPSANGTSWTLVGTETITMANTISVGLAVTSHDTSATATFDHVVVP